MGVGVVVEGRGGGEEDAREEEEVREVVRLVLWREGGSAGEVEGGFATRTSKAALPPKLATTAHAKRQAKLTSSSAHCSSSVSMLYIGGMIWPGMLTSRSDRTRPMCFGAAAVEASAVPGTASERRSWAWIGEVEGILPRRYLIRSAMQGVSCGRDGRDGG